MKEQSICGQTECLMKVSSFDQINMPQNLNRTGRLNYSKLHKSVESEARIEALFQKFAC